MQKILVVVMALLAACSKGDECQRFVDKAFPVMSSMGEKKPPPDAKSKFLDECRKSDKMKKDPVFKCVLDANGDDGVKKCMSTAFGSYMAKSKSSEAKIQLNKLGKNLKVFYAVESKFPAGKAGPTPAEPCCKGEGGKCAAVPADTWMADPVWSALDFMTDEPTQFQYAYESDGKTATATATGDLDCDGTPIVYKLEVTANEGAATMNIAEPDLSAD